MREKKTILIGSTVVSYVVSASQSGTPIVFLHGWRSQAAVWSKIMDALAGNSSYAPDLPGFGDSEIPPRPFSVRDYASLVKDFMQKLSLEGAVLVGHSFGGRIAIVLAAEHPELVSRLVLVDSAGIREKDARRDTIGFFAKLFRPLFAPAFMSPLRRLAYGLLGAEDYLATPELQETFKHVVAEDLQAFLPRISQPTLLLWGEHDLDTPLSYARTMERAIPGGKLAIIPNAGHFSFLDAPEPFIFLLKSFI